MATPNCPFDTQPLDQSQPVAVPRLSGLSYTNQDFYSLKTRLVKLIQERFPDDFNDFVESSLAIMLMEIYAFIGDMISFKADQTANENFIDSVTEVDNAFRLAKLVGFQPTPPIAASALFTATINNTLSVDLTIPAGVQVNVTSSGQRIFYELFAADANNQPIFAEDIIIPAGSLTNSSVVGLEGRTIQEGFVANGLPNQNFQLSNSPVIFDSILVDVDGVRWTEVEFFTDSQPRREFRVEFDSSWNAFVIFGNNTTGLIPAEGSSVSVTYRVGGGTIGNVVTGYIDFQKSFPVAGLDFSVPVSFRNYTKGQFGYDGDGVDDIRTKLPGYIKSQERAVTGEDYKLICDKFTTPYNGQIGKSIAVLRNYGCAGNVIDIFILALDGINGLTEASPQLKDALREELATLQMLTDFVCLRDGVVLLTDIHIDVTLDKSYRKLKDEIDTKINQIVAQFFALSNWEFGQTLKSSDLMKDLASVKEANTFDVTFVTDDSSNSGTIITTKYYEIIRPDTVSINYLFV